MISSIGTGNSFPYVFATYWLIKFLSHDTRQVFTRFAKYCMPLLRISFSGSSKIFPREKYIQGWKAVVFLRTDQEREQYRRRNVQRIETGDRLFVRPHHLMCLACWYAGGKNRSPRPNDTLFEIWQRIRREPDVSITLVEGTCMACDCCDGFHPSNGRCVHSCGLIRDYKKDLDVLQKLGLMPGATMKACELFALLFQRIPSTRDICAYGDGIERSEEWKICSGPDGNPGYVATRRTGVFNEDRS